VSLTYTDIFCGAGGSSIGLTEAGLELKLAANHWDRAIETHSANFTNAEHLCADVSNYDMRRFPRTDILWASPICTENSPAGGRKRRPKGQLDMFEQDGMLKPREHLRGQRFPDSYIVTGNNGEQTMQAGNAVSSNVAHWLGERVAAVLA
jgi:site-specific DNA-cytosine methylase